MPSASCASEFFLVVRFWIAPEAEARVLAWLEGGHVTEVLSQPGFQWCRRLKVEARDGWPGYAMLYGIESRAAFDAYNGNQALMAQFARERQPFASQLKIERFFGEVDYAADRE